MQIEEWKPVPGYEGLYEVSDYGRVRTLPRHGTGNTAKILRGFKDKDGYLSVDLSKGGIRNRRRIHHLVLETFSGLRPNPSNVCLHLNDVPGDNRLSNLKWGSVQENHDQMVERGRSLIGSRNHEAKLTERQAEEAYVMALFGCPLGSIAERFGVTHQAISYLTRGKTWKHLFSEQSYST